MWKPHTTPSLQPPMQRLRKQTMQITNKYTDIKDLNFRGLISSLF